MDFTQAQAPKGSMKKMLAPMAPHNPQRKNSKILYVVRQTQHSAFKNLGPMLVCMQRKPKNGKWTWTVARFLKWEEAPSGH